MVSTGSNSAVNAVAGSDTDLVVGVISHNDVRTVGQLVGTVGAALSTSSGATDSRIVLADASSTDGTKEAARAAAMAQLLEVEYQPPVALAALPYHGRPGRADAVRALLQAARQLGAKAAVLLDAALTNVTPEWIDRLVAPIVDDGFDYVSPYFARRAHEGAITRGIVYPMFRALYGVRLRQPAAAEFACSGRLVSHFLEQDFWDAEQAEVGIDLWLSVTAATGGFRMCEASLGTRATSRDTPSDMSTALAQVVGALFVDLEQRVSVWQRTRKSVPIPIVGPVAEIASASPDVEALIESFRLGYRELREIWTWVLPPRTIIELRRLAEAAPGRFQFDDALWADIIYDFALGYNLRVMPNDHLLRSLTPLYSGWLGSFVAQMSGASLPQIEDRVDQVCLAFEVGRRHLISGWRWPERLR
jgi:hypothetical protein